MTTHPTVRRVTLESLRYYVPIYQRGDLAIKRLLAEGANLSPQERHRLDTLVRLGELALQRLAVLASPLIIREVQKLIAGSHLRSRDDMFDILYYAGIDGMRLGLKKFDIDKMNNSSTNYLFQWIVTYARKELNVLEAPFGIPPSRFQIYKKVSAVRKKLTDKLQREVSNEEVLEYFHSGQADVANMNGRLINKGKPSQANKNITLALVEEQEQFESDMMNVVMVDTQEDHSAAMNMTSEDATIFDETVFGVFSKEYHVTEEARVVIMSELQVSLAPEDTEILDNLDPKMYHTLAGQWKNLIKDKNGPFHDFLMHNINTSFEQFDVRATLAAIESNPKPVNRSLYRILFVKKKLVE